MANHNKTFGCRILKIARLQQSLTISSSLGIRDPNALLCIIDLGLVSTLHIKGRQEKLRGVRIGQTPAIPHDILQSWDQRSKRSSLYHRPWTGQHASYQVKAGETPSGPDRPDPSPA